MDEMQNKVFDVVIVGAGAMGSAAAYAATQAGASVLVVERFQSPHSLGSSHGHSRLIRKAYFEHPDYVPLLLRSYDLWHNIEQRWGQPLLHQTGLVVVGESSHPILAGIKNAAAQYHLKIKTFTSGDLKNAYPHFQVETQHVGLYEPEGGVLLSENCVDAFCTMAQRQGAEFRWWTEVIDWKAGGKLVELSLKNQRGGTETVTCRKLILTAGAWMSQIWKLNQVELSVRRVPMFWFDAPNAFDMAAGMSAFAFALPQGFFYGMPNIDGRGVKVSRHLGCEELANPSDLSQEVYSTDIEPVQEFLLKYIPALAKPHISHMICMYTLSQDEHFVVGTHPETERVVFASACSGHGFKFAPVIGQALSDLALEGRTDLPIDFLSPSRKLS